MKVILNEGVTDYRDDNIGLIRDLMIHRSLHFPFQNVEMVKDSVVGILKLSLEGLHHQIGAFPKRKLDEKEKLDMKAVSNLIARINKFLKFADRIKKKETLIDRTYNFLLSLEGLSTLPGFGFHFKEYGNKTTGNPEKRSLYQVR